jgi:superkiller protein 3
MASTKAALKAAKAAIDAKEWDAAIKEAQTALSSDPRNFFAKLFLGRAYDKQGKVAESAKAYKDASELKPDDEQPWIGLQTLYEAQGGAGIDGYIWASWNLAKLLAAAGNKHKCQVVVDKMIGVAQNRGTKAQYKKALAIQLPSGPVYEFLEGRLPHPSHTYKRIAEATEADERAREKTEVETRRTRIGAKKDQVVAEVKREIYAESDLEEIYQGMIDWTEDDSTRRKFEEKLLQRAYDTLLVLPNDQKAEKRDQVLKQAHGMVIIKHPFDLAWDLELEWTDVENISSLDASTFYDYITFFPHKGLSKVLKPYLSSSISPFPAPPPPEQAADANSDDDEIGGGVSLVATSSEDILLAMTDGLTEAKNSGLAHRLMGEYYNHLEEYESAVDTLRAGLKVLAGDSKKSGLKLQNNTDAMNNMLATALVHYQSPRFHGEARKLFDNILSRNSNFTPALIGVGLILEEDEEYTAAIDYLSKALKRDPKNARVGAELAWCKALNGDAQKGLTELERYYKMMDVEARDMRAETLYRIGKCQWDIDPSRASRKDRKGAYAQFLAAIKANINYAPAYTMLGTYYSDYGRDKKRARQCFQKAFELSPSEVEAAERLARSFADQGDWDIVEVIAQRVVDSGKTRPPPGSKKKGISWPYSALGVVQMNKQEYQQAIVSFLAALRISPDDYHSYVGLGESYHNSGRYNSAARTFNYAENPHDGVVMKKGGEGESWFTQYMLANVNRELGAYDEAIAGYKEVLATRKQEFGVEIALLQTYLERAWRNVETGFFGGAIDSTEKALEVAADIVEYMPDAFNLWKAVADACAMFSVVQDQMERLPKKQIRNLLVKSFEEEKYNLFAENDGVEYSSLASVDQSEESDTAVSYELRFSLTASMLAHKRAIISCAHDQHAQAVSWYNLGWAEYRAHTILEDSRPSSAPSNKPSKPPTRYLKAAMRCFKRAIELEAGNADFWNALGVATTKLNPKVAQHAFVRSLHLNERNVKAWTNLGVLYFLQNDFELAHNAFTRAQSTDPDYAHAWVGEGSIALMWGNIQEALLHFKHAFEISEGGSVIVKKEYAAHTFDQLIKQPATLDDALHLIQPLFALQQLGALSMGDEPFELLSALYNERIGGTVSAVDTLTSLCARLEAEYERTESPETMVKFAQAKADLARNHLAAHTYSAASEEADLALTLTSEDDTVPTHVKDKLRLSARLTLGLASYYLKDMDAALAAFRAALKESNAEPDVVCLLAEVLWARGGSDERSVAKEQLFDAIQRHPSHVNSTVLLGAMSVVEDEPDTETVEAVREELESLRLVEGLTPHDLTRIERVLEAMAQIHPKHGDVNSEIEALNEIQESVMLYPWKATGWRRLVQESEEGYAKEMALKVAMGNVPPKGPLGAEELSDAFAQAGTIADAQRAIMVAPWRREGWEALVESVGGARS